MLLLSACAGQPTTSDTAAAPVLDTIAPSGTVQALIIDELAVVQASDLTHTW